MARAPRRREVGVLRYIVLGSGPAVARAVSVYVDCCAYARLCLCVSVCVCWRAYERCCCCCRTLKGACRACTASCLARYPTANVIARV